MYRTSVTQFAATALLVLALHGCSQHGDQPVAATVASEAQGEAQGEASAKDEIATPLSPDEQRDLKAQRFIALNYGFAVFNDTYIVDQYFLSVLSEARDSQPRMPEIDEAASVLLEVVQKYLPNWKRLIEYNKARRFEDDHGAEGRRMLPAYREGIDRIGTAVARFSENVDAIAKEANARTIAKYMETSLSDMRAEYERRLAESPGSLPPMEKYDDVLSSLTCFAGKYRESRSRPAVFNDAIAEFNRAISFTNAMLAQRSFAVDLPGARDLPPARHGSRIAPG